MKIRSISLLIALIFSIASSSVACGSQTLNKQAANATPHQISATNVSSRPTEWKRFEFDKPLNFGLILPSEPEQRTSIFPGKTEISHVFISSNDSGVYGAIYIDDLPSLASHWKGSGSNLFYELFIKDFALKIDEQTREKEINLESKLKLEAERQVTVSGLKGLERVFSIGDFHGRLQLVRVGQAGFCVIAIWKQTTLFVEQDSFFSSVKIASEEH